MRAMAENWALWAGLSAVFAALTAILGKLGVHGVHPDFATFIRTGVILLFIGVLVGVTGTYQPLSAIPSKGLLFLAMSALATGASWLCYYRALAVGPASRVAPVDKLSIVLVAVFAVAFLGEQLSLKHWLGIGLITAGGVLMVSQG